jgi:hypothetical protein
MNVTQCIQVAVARADLLLCQLAALPWKRMAVSVLLAWIVIHVYRTVMRDDG